MFDALLLLGAVALAVVLILLPGWLVLRYWLPGYLALGCSPAFVFIIVSFATMIPGIAHSWNIFTALTIFVLAYALSFGLHALIVRGLGGRRSLVRMQILRASASLFTSYDRLGICIGALLAGMPVLLAVRSAAQPAQAWDAVFHQSAIAMIKETGDAFAFGGLDPLIGFSGIYYPLGLDALAALMPANATIAYNAVTIAMLMLMPMVIAIVIKSLLPRSTHLVGLTAIVTGGIKTFTVSATLLGVFGYVGGMIATCASLALMLFVLKGRHYSLAPVAIFFILGSAAIHGSAAFSLLVAGLPLVIYAWIYLCLNILPSRWKLIGWILGSLILLVLPVLIWAASVKLSSVFSYERKGGSMTSGLVEWPLDLSSIVASPVSGWGSLFVAVIAIIGYALWSTGKTRLDRRVGICMAIACAAAVLLTWVALGPDGPHRLITSPWYRQGARLSMLAWVLTLLGFAVALRWMERRWGPRDNLNVLLKRVWNIGPKWVVVLVILAFLTPITQSYSRYEVAAKEYRPEQIRWGTMMTTPQVALLQRAAARGSLQNTLHGAVLLADPMQGGSFYYSRAGVNTVFKQLSSPIPKRYERLFKVLAGNPTDREVCAAIEDISFVYIVKPDAKRDKTLANGMKKGAYTQAISNIPPGILKYVADSGDGGIIYSVACPW